MFRKIIVGVLVYCFSTAALACSCVHYSLEEKIAKSSNVFVVKVDRIETIEKGSDKNFSGGLRYGHFKVVNTLKGSSAGATYIESADAPVCCICQAKVEENTHYLVFSSDNSNLTYGQCGFTRPIRDVESKIETVKALVKEYKPTEIFSGVYVSSLELFLNDDGTRTKLSRLRLKDYYSAMSRISFEGIKLKSGRILVTQLNEESRLNEQEIANVEELVDLEELKTSSNADSDYHLSQELN